MNALKRELFDKAIVINDLEQKGLISDRNNIKKLREAFAKVINSDTPIDHYLFFTANRDSYSKEDAQYIECKLIMDCKKFIEEENENLKKAMIPSMN